MSDRYFLISFNHERGFGNCTVITNGHVPNNLNFQKDTKAKLGYVTNEPIVILSIYEFKSKEDLDSYDNI